MRPCDCKSIEDVQKLKHNIVSTREGTISVFSPKYVILNMGNCVIEIGKETFKDFAEFYLKDQGDK